MRCPQCGSPDMVTSRTDYPYTESGMSNVILKGITVHLCVKCGERIPVISRIKEWHERIAMALLAKPSVLTGEEFRFLRKEMRLKASELASLMGVHKVTVSRWETNAESISASADRLMRYVYVTRRVESMAKRLSALNWAMFSDTIQGTTRWLETRVKLIKRMSPGRELITIDLDAVQSCAEQQHYRLEQLNNANRRIFTLNVKGDCFVTSGNLSTLFLGPVSPTPCQPILQAVSGETRGTSDPLTPLQEVALDG